MLWGHFWSIWACKDRPKALLFRSRKKRQKKRERAVPEYIVKKSWKGVQENIGKFKSLFKRSNFLIIDNNVSANETTTVVLRKLYNHTSRLINAPVHSYIAKSWIEQQRLLRNRLL